LQSTTAEQIQIFDFGIMSMDGKEVAKGGSATQSSTLKGDETKFGATNAIDGISTTFSHTNDHNSWWQVDLGEQLSIDSIEIANRWCGDTTDQPQCLCRLSNATLSLIDNITGGSTIASKSLGDTCGKKSLSFHLGCSSEVCVHVLTFDCE
jgi:hypothetical protein